jgi:hypothetical protein
MVGSARRPAARARACARSSGGNPIAPPHLFTPAPFPNPGSQEDLALTFLSRRPSWGALRSARAAAAETASFGTSGCSRAAIFRFFSLSLSACACLSMR